MIVLGAVLAALAVAAGAFGAHGLRDTLTAERLAAWETAARYQMYHALAILLVGVLLTRRPGRSLRAAGWLFLVGAVLFSGSLYALALTDRPYVGIVTPFGGAAFLAGWVCVAAGSWRRVGS